MQYKDEYFTGIQARIKEIQREIERREIEQGKQDSPASIPQTKVTRALSPENRIKFLEQDLQENLDLLADRDFDRLVISSETRNQRVLVQQMLGVSERIAIPMAICYLAFHQKKVSPEKFSELIDQTEHKDLSEFPTHIIDVVFDYKETIALKRMGLIDDPSEAKQLASKASKAIAAGTQLLFDKLFDKLN